MSREHRLQRAPIIFGAVDGLTVILGLIAGLVVSGQSSAAVWHSALGGGLAELVGMAAGQRQSAPEDGIADAVACGAASGLGCIVPAAPYLVASGVAALVPALLLVVAVAGLVTWLRPQKGWGAVAETYGVLVGAAVLSAAASLI